MNRKPPGVVAEIKRLILAGNGERLIRAQLGVSKNTVRAYRNELLFEAAFQGRDLCCSCGLKLGHRGWCSYRLERSPTRQEWLRKWTGSKTAIILAHRRAPAIIRKWKEPQIYIRPVGDLESRVRAQIPSLIPLEIRDDLCQDVMLAILSKELALEDISAKMRDYVIHARKFMYDRFKNISFDSPVPGTNLRLHEIIAAPVSHE